MTLGAITPTQALQHVARSLRVSAADSSDTINSQLIGQALRRAIQIMAPCASHELARAVHASLLRLPAPGINLAEAVEAELETLIVYGDILELRPTDVDQWQSSKFSLRPAPASFVRRVDGSIFLLGSAGDSDGMLFEDEELFRQLRHRGALRFLDAGNESDLAARLTEMGFLELSERAWLRAPTVESARTYIERWRTHCAREPCTPGSISGLRILDGQLATSFYRHRWIEAFKENTGLYVGRRPQRYGADIWCLVELEKGAPRRLLDINSMGDRVRPCDIAWRIQMAMDAARNKPQQFKCREAVAGYIFDFFSPLPSWAERRLALAGDKLPGEGCLFSYTISTAAVSSEARFLVETLWLAHEST